MYTGRFFPLILLAISATLQTDAAEATCAHGKECPARPEPKDNLLIQVRGALKTKDVEAGPDPRLEEEDGGKNMDEEKHSGDVTSPSLLESREGSEIIPAIVVWIWGSCSKKQSLENDLNNLQSQIATCNTQEQAIENEFATYRANLTADELECACVPARCFWRKASNPHFYDVAHMAAHYQSQLKQKETEINNLKATEQQLEKLIKREACTALEDALKSLRQSVEDVINKIKTTLTAVVCYSISFGLTMLGQTINAKLGGYFTKIGALQKYCGGQSKKLEPSDVSKIVKSAKSSGSLAELGANVTEFTSEGTSSSVVPHQILAGLWAIFINICKASGIPELAAFADDETTAIVSFIILRLMEAACGGIGSAFTAIVKELVLCQMPMCDSTAWAKCTVPQFKIGRSLLQSIEGAAPEDFGRDSVFQPTVSFQLSTYSQNPDESAYYNQCRDPANYRPITTEAECKQMATDFIQGGTWKSSAAHANWPPGCFRYSGVTGTDVYLGTNPAGTGHSGHVMVCKKVDYTGCYAFGPNKGAPAGMDTWSSTEGSNNFYFGGARLTGTKPEMKTKCAQECSARSGYKYYLLGDSSGCHCAKQAPTGAKDAGKCSENELWHLPAAAAPAYTEAGVGYCDWHYNNKSGGNIDVAACAKLCQDEPNCKVFTVGATGTTLGDLLGCRYSACGSNPGPSACPADKQCPIATHSASVKYELAEAAPTPPPPPPTYELLGNDACIGYETSDQLRLITKIADLAACQRACDQNSACTTIQIGKPYRHRFDDFIWNEMIRHDETRCYLYSGATHGVSLGTNGLSEYKCYTKATKFSWEYGNNGFQNCSTFCQGKGYGATGAVVGMGNLFTASHQTPCCPLFNAWGAAATCNACQCNGRVPVSQNLLKTYLAGVGQTGCNRGWEVPQAECLAAAIAKAGSSSTSQLQVGSWPQGIPSGCSVKTADKVAYFNTKDGVNNNGQYGPLCILFVEPPTPVPTPVPTPSRWVYHNGRRIIMDS